MKKLTGMTAGELIKQLQKLPSDMLVVTEAGDATVKPVSAIEPGYAYQFTTSKAHNMSNFLHCRKKFLHESDLLQRKTAVKAVWIQ